MASESRFSYYRLRKYQNGLNLDEDRNGKEEDTNNAILEEVRTWYGFRKLAGGRRRLKKAVSVRGLRKYLRKRSRVLFARFRASWCRAVKRMKNGQVHLNDLFGGNYLCFQR